MRFFAKPIAAVRAVYVVIRISVIMAVSEAFVSAGGNIRAIGPTALCASAVRHNVSFVGKLFAIVADYVVGIFAVGNFAAHIAVSAAYRAGSVAVPAAKRADAFIVKLMGAFT